MSISFRTGSSSIGSCLTMARTMGAQFFDTNPAIKDTRRWRRKLFRWINCHGKGLTTEHSEACSRSHLPHMIQRNESQRALGSRAPEGCCESRFRRPVRWRWARAVASDSPRDPTRCHCCRSSVPPRCGLHCTGSQLVSLEAHLYHPGSRLVSLFGPLVSSEPATRLNLGSTRITPGLATAHSYHR